MARKSRRYLLPARNAHSVGWRASCAQRIEGADYRQSSGRTAESLRVQRNNSYLLSPSSLVTADRSRGAALRGHLPAAFSQRSGSRGASIRSAQAAKAAVASRQRNVSELGQRSWRFGGRSLFGFRLQGPENPDIKPARSSSPPLDRQRSLLQCHYQLEHGR